MGRNDRNQDYSKENYKFAQVDENIIYQLIDQNPKIFKKGKSLEKSSTIWKININVKKGYLISILNIICSSDRYKWFDNLNNEVGSVYLYRKEFKNVEKPIFYIIIYRYGIRFEFSELFDGTSNGLPRTNRIITDEEEKLMISNINNNINLTHIKHIINKYSKFSNNTILNIYEDIQMNEVFSSLFKYIKKFKLYKNIDIKNLKNLFNAFIITSEDIRVAVYDNINNILIELFKLIGDYYYKYLEYFIDNDPIKYIEFIKICNKKIRTKYEHLFNAEDFSLI